MAYEMHTKPVPPVVVYYPTEPLRRDPVVGTVKRKPMRDVYGYVSMRLNGLTGGYNVILDAWAPDCSCSAAAGRYAVYCTKHNAYANTPSRKTASLWLADPVFFCPGCIKVYRANPQWVRP